MHLAQLGGTAMNVFTRTRKTDNQTSTLITIDEYRTDGTSGHYLDSPIALEGGYKSISDNQHKGQNVRKRLANGEIVLGALSIVDKNRQYSNGHVSYTATSGYHVEYDGDIAALFESIAPAPNTSIDASHLASVAFMKAMGKTNSESIMGGEAGRDLATTVKMLRHPFGASRTLLAKIHKTAKRSYRKTARSIALANSNAWLEYQYGWKPLLLDMSQAVKLANSFRERHESRLLVVRATEQDSREGTLAFSGIRHPTKYTFWSGSGSISASRHVSANAGVLFRTENRTSSALLAQDYRLGCDSLIQTGWEIIPYSFVVDWFVKVGPWLEAVVPNPNITVVGTWCTTVSKYAQACSVSGITGRTGTGISETGHGGTSSYWENTVFRDLEPTIPSIPPANFKMNSLVHAISGTSLLLPKILSGLRDLRH